MSLRLLIVPALLALPLLAGDDWNKVKDLAGGSELRIYMQGSAQPRTALYADATDTNLIVVIKNQQTAIPKGEIDRIDARPPAKKGGKKLVSETHTGEPAVPSAEPSPDRSAPGSRSYSTSTMITSADKGDFTTVYRRVSGAPPEKHAAEPAPR